MKVVLDCNVLISAGLNAGPCREVITAVVRLHHCILSKGILREYVLVAQRRHFARSAATMFDLIKLLSGNAVFVIPSPALLRLPDPKDQIYLDTAVTAHADVLITGNKKHFPDAVYQGVKIVSPREFLELAAGRE